MATHTAEVRKLRTELEDRFGRAILPAIPAPREAEGFRVGVREVDRLLPEGVVRGELTLWVGEATSGRTAALRSLVRECCTGGGRAAVVDSGRTLDASFACTGAGPIEGLWVIRPPSLAAGEDAAWAAEALLRAGVFDLVVLDGSLPAATEAHRLRALAKERDAALLITAPLFSSPSRLPTSLPFRPDVRLEFRSGSGERGLRRGGRFRRRGRLRLLKGSSSARPGGEREVELLHEPADRLCSSSPPPDRTAGGWG
jgi:hypothetical protein